MKSSRVMLSALLAVLGGALLALGPSSGRCGFACASDPHDRPSACLQGLPAASDTSDAAGNEAPSHFDNGPAPGDELAAQSVDNSMDYRFEYPESTTTAPPAPPVEPTQPYYLHKYGYHYAPPAAPYAGDATASTTPENKGSSTASVSRESSSCPKEEEHAVGADNSAEDFTYDRRPLETDAEVNTGYQGYSTAYPDENYAYRDMPASESESDIAALREATDNALLEWLEAKYQFSQRRYGEPGEILGRTIEQEPESYYAFPTSEYEALDYFADEVRQARIAAAAAAAEMPSRAVAAETPPTSEMPEMQGSADNTAVATPSDDSSLHADESPVIHESGLELFSWDPVELLGGDDQRLLRQLERLCEEPSPARQNVFDAYLESLGMEAIAFARRFEDATTIQTRSLADDLPGAAALLAAYRLVEQGELGMDEAIDLARRSLRSMTPEWIAGVRAVATQPENVSSPQYAEAPMQGTVASQPVDNVPGEARVGEALQRATLNVLGDLKGAFQSLPIPSMPSLPWTNGR